MERNKGVLIFYGIPACGHTFSNLYLAGSLAGKGFRVIYYSTDSFREVIEANGCEYRSYPIDESSLELTDGEKLFKLYRLILQYTWEMLPELLIQARRERPCGVIFESLALWGRLISARLSLPGASFYSIAAVDWTWRRPQRGVRLPIGPWRKGLRAYASGFLAGLFRCLGELPRALVFAYRLKKRYGAKELGMLPVLMNRSDCNLCGYSRLFQPGGREFGPEYRFLGPMSVRRTVPERNDFVLPDQPYIYVSLGTIFNRDERLLRAVTDQLGGRGEWRVILIRDGEVPAGISFPENFIVRSFVNQNEVLAHASLFITAGGVNSIHEALYYGVPCLLCPQQGEQLVNAKQFEKLGFGRILRDPDRLLQEARACMELKKHWNEKKRRQMISVFTDESKQLSGGRCGRKGL